MGQGFPDGCMAHPAGIFFLGKARKEDSHLPVVISCPLSEAFEKKLARNPTDTGKKSGAL